MSDKNEGENVDSEEEDYEIYCKCFIVLSLSNLM